MPSLTEIDGVGPSLAAAFVKKKYLTIAKIAAAEPVELSAVPGISTKGATLIIASAKTLLEKSLSQKDVRKKTAKSVAPLKIKTNINSKMNGVKGKKEKIKNLKRTIKKLKKENKKVVAKYKKKVKKSKSKKSGKKK
ncbi:MAG: hypothetical protein HOJ06_07585 [Rhodospirillaceae bacterium]|jgi:Holliday junction resolvasome RuvABC DNA-binding subunit|nr:hypothetical protein [Rhodospirillaceae bacterium]MBT5811096.1 hypothetical protein [Rhodospirillaceae bacterium]